MRSVGMVAVLVGGALSIAQPPAVEKERLIATLHDLPTRRAARGSAEDVAGLRAAETLIVERLKSFGIEPRTEPIEWSLPTHTAPQVWNNIVVEFRGAESPDEVLLIGAHFDAVPNAPGADDNGTGTAALLEIARVLKDRPLKRTVRLVFFNLEEVGLVGSKWHAKTLSDKPAADPAAAPRPRVIGMVSLEMLGYFTDAPDSQRSPIKAIPNVYTPPTVGDFIAVVTVKGYQDFSRRLTAEMSKGSPGLKVMAADFLPVPVPDMLRSDHAPFMALGIPSVMLTDTANFRNPNYHSPSDTVETVDAERFTAVVRGLAAAVEAIAEPVSAPAQDTAAPEPPPGRVPKP